MLVNINANVRYGMMEIQINSSSEFTLLYTIICYATNAAVRLPVQRPLMCLNGMLNTLAMQWGVLSS